MRLVIFFYLILNSLNLSAQDPVSWSNSIVAEDGKTYVSLNAEVKEGWYIYSMDTDPDGPVPTEVIFDKSATYTLDGKVTEHGDVIKKYDELFEVDVMKYKERVEFRQSLNAYKADATIKCEVTYMTCDSERCLPPQTLEFEIQQ